MFEGTRPSRNDCVLQSRHLCRQLRIGRLRALATNLCAHGLLVRPNYSPRSPQLVESRPQVHSACCTAGVTAASIRTPRHHLLLSARFRGPRRLAPHLRSWLSALLRGPHWFSPPTAPRGGTRCSSSSRRYRCSTTSATSFSTCFWIPREGQPWFCSSARQAVQMFQQSKWQSGNFRTELLDRIVRL